MGRGQLKSIAFAAAAVGAAVVPSTQCAAATFAPVATNVTGTYVAAASFGGRHVLVGREGDPSQPEFLQLVNLAATAPTATPTKLEVGPFSAVAISGDGKYVAWAAGGFLTSKPNSCAPYAPIKVWVQSTSATSKPREISLPAAPKGFINDGVPRLLVSNSGQVAAISSFARYKGGGDCTFNYDGSDTNLLTLWRASVGSATFTRVASNMRSHGIAPAVASAVEAQKLGVTSEAPEAVSTIALCAADGVTVMWNHGPGFGVRTYRFHYSGQQHTSPVVCSTSSDGTLSVEDGQGYRGS